MFDTEGWGFRLGLGWYNDLVLSRDVTDGQRMSAGFASHVDRLPKPDQIGSGPNSWYKMPTCSQMLLSMYPIYDLLQLTC